MGGEERSQWIDEGRRGEERSIGEEKKKWFLTMKVLEIPAGFPLSSLCVMMGEANEY